MMKMYQGLGPANTTCPISVLNYELDYNRPSISGPTTCGPSREVSRCYLHVLRSIGEGNSQDPVDIDEDAMPMNTVPAFKTRKEFSLSMPPASTNTADENITMDQPPVVSLPDAFSAPQARTPMSPRRQESTWPRQVIEQRIFAPLQRRTATSEQIRNRKMSKR
ncbi:hypothetical protein L5515_019239 [Caenorhabditis briggsae]|uniref:Uncharacterized protein n=1 Tax=Caenorhabditis briggsae TaxID=6238 RepID=A0AAE9JTL1_CAEBR|nr:hypothetical protein L5515_019239 [Caenorhabditis briggsae]